MSFNKIIFSNLFPQEKREVLYVLNVKIEKQNYLVFICLYIFFAFFVFILVCLIFIVCFVTYIS